jgi:predicted Zn finger-like uncharacterized protein
MDENHIRTICPNCAARFRAGLSAVGLQLKCPKCGEPFVVEGFEEEEELLSEEIAEAPKKTPRGKRVEPRISLKSKISPVRPDYSGPRPVGSAITMIICFIFSMLVDYLAINVSDWAHFKMTFHRDDAATTALWLIGIGAASPLLFIPVMLLTGSKINLNLEVRLLGSAGYIIGVLIFMLSEYIPGSQAERGDREVTFWFGRYITSLILVGWGGIVMAYGRIKFYENEL